MKRFYLIITIRLLACRLFGVSMPMSIWNTPSRNILESMPCGGWRYWDEYMGRRR